MQHHAISALHIGGYAAKRDGQVVEAGNAGLREGDAVQQQADAEAGIETIGPSQPMFYAERCLHLIIAAILFAAIGKLAVGGLGKQCFIPVNAFREFLHFCGRHARGIHHADDAAHAGASHAIHGDVILLQPLNHPDLRQAERCATAERETDAGPARRR
jgi:hypothetical protein